jgi:ABC-type multidrug transport system fused ATPase/permease subunit
MRQPEGARYRTSFWRLLAFLKPYKATLWASVALATVSQAGSLAFPYLTGRVAHAIEVNDRTLVPELIGVVLLVGVVKAVAMVFRRLISGKQALGVELDMRNAIYAKLIRLSFGYFDRSQTGQLMSRATVDLQSVRFFLGYGLIFFFQHVFTIVGVCVLLFIASWKLALVVLVIAPVLVAIAYRYSNVSHPVLRDVQQKMADVATVAEENVVGVHVVKAFAQEQAEQDKFEGRTEALFAQSVRANRQRAFYVPVLSFVPLLGQAAVLSVRAGVHLVQPLAVDDDLPAAHARDVDRRGTAGDGVGGTDLPDHRRAGGDPGSARSPGSARRAGARSLRRGHLRLRPGAAGAARHRPRARAGQDGRADRAHGIG